MNRFLRRTVSLLLCMAMVFGYLAVLPDTAVTATEEYAKPVSKNWLANNNPSFEELADIEGWVVSDKNAVFQSNVAAKNGNTSLKMKDQSKSKEYFAYSSKVSILPGVKYYAAAQVCGSASGVITMRFYDEAGKEMTDYTISKTVTTSSKWKEVVISSVSPVGAKKADVKISTTAAGVGEVYFDEVAFYNLPKPTEIQNSSFETASAENPNYPANWTPNSAYGNYLNSLNTNPAYVHEGSKSLKITVAIAAATGKNTINQGMYSEQTDVIANNRYDYTFWVKSEPFTDEESTAHYFVDFYNIEGQKIDLTGKVLADQAGNSLQKAFNPTAEWQKVTVPVTAPSGAVKASVMVRTSSICRAPIYLDEMQLTHNTAAPTISNPGFEGGFAANGIPNGWQIYESNHCVPETKEKTEGNYSLKMDNTVNTNYSGTYYEVPASVGEVWKVTVDYKGEGAYVQFRTHAANRAMIDDIRGVGVDIGNGWKRCEITMEVKPGDAGDPATLRVMMYMSKSSPTVAYFDNVKLERLSAPEPVPYSNLLNNSGFEIRTQIPYWDSTALPTGNKLSQTDEHAGGDRGNFVLKMLDDNTKSRTDFKLHFTDITVGKYYQAAVDYRSDTEVQLTFTFWDKDGAPIYPLPGHDGEEYDGKWHHIGILAQVPEGAVKMTLTVSTTSIGTGTAYIDNLYVADYDINKDPDIEGAVSVKSPGWDVNFNDVGHPRTYFREDDLEALRKSVKVNLTNDFGYSPKVTYDELIKLADQYAVEKKVRVTTDHQNLPFFWYDLDVFEDFNTFEVFKTDPEGYGGVFAYGYPTGAIIQDRMQTLALAYAISQDTKYAERAVYYAMKMSDWTPWGLLRRENSPGYSEGAGMDTSYLVVGAATVYDLCYDYMTQAQRTKLSDAILNLGLKELAKDLQMFINHNGWLARVNGLLIGASAIIEESNRAQVEPYLTRGYNYAKQFLDNSYEVGWQEGFNYTEHSLDSMVEGIDVLSRATGKGGFIDHPYFSEILVDWALYGITPGSGTLPPVSDMGTTQKCFMRVMMLLNKAGNEKAGFYIKQTNILANTTAFAKLLYMNPNPVIPKEKDVQQTLTLVEKFGYGYLRSGFGTLDVALTMVSNDSQPFHNHYDKNSFIIGFNSQLLATDHGYGVVNMGEEHPGWSFGYSYGHNTIFVDGNPQHVMGKSSLEAVVSNDLYGHLLGDAAGAYGGILTQFDRHAILLNHKDKPYYIIIDELNSNSNHVYNWNLYTKDWSTLQVDYVTVPNIGDSASGNTLGIVKDPDALFVQFVGNEKLDVVTHLHMDAYGPLLKVNSPSTKKYEFMAVINADADMSSGEVIGFGPLVTRMYYETENPEGFPIKWSTSNRDGREIIKNMDLFGSQYIFFRGEKPGDYIEFPFTVENTGEYDVKLRVPKAGYGYYEIFLDGVSQGMIKPYAPDVKLNNHPLGKMTLTAGEHTLRFVLIEPNPIGKNTYISCEGVLLQDPDKEVKYESSVNVVETYDDSTVLGAKISYGTTLSDIVLHNRGNGIVSGGGAVSDGSQVTLMGIYGSDVTEGFTVVNGTSLKFGETELLKASGKMTVAVDYRESRQPIHNTEGEPVEEKFSVIPITYLSTSADATRTITYYAGNDAPYVVKVDGKEVAAVYENGMLTLEVPAGEHMVEVTGVHTCVYTEEIASLEYIKTWATCDSPAVFYKSCACGEKSPTDVFTSGEPKAHAWGKAEVTTAPGCETPGVGTVTCKSCGATQTTEIAPTNHKPVEVPAKDATWFEEGHIAHWACACGRVYLDAEGKQMVDKSEVTIPAIFSAGTIIVIVVVVLALGAGGVFLFIKLKSRKKEEQTPEAEGQAPEAEEQAPEAEEQAPEAEEQAPEAEEQAPEAEEQAPETEE